MSERKQTGSGSAQELGLTEKTSFHGEQVLQKASMTGNQKPKSAPEQSAPGGHTIK